MKKALYILGMVVLTSSFSSRAQELAPDQNPNYQISAQKYAERSDELTANQGETVQDTYKAYDWREAKVEAKQDRIQRRHELRKLRIQSRNRFYRPFPRRGYCAYNGWGNNGWNNGYYNNGFLGSPTLGGVLLGAGIGYGLYPIFN